MFQFASGGDDIVLYVVATAPIKAKLRMYRPGPTIMARIVFSGSQPTSTAARFLTPVASSSNLPQLPGYAGDQLGFRFLRIRPAPQVYLEPVGSGGR
jgi:hypothetical protein